jgi:cytochrome c peroxidase
MLKNVGIISFASLVAVIVFYFVSPNDLASGEVHRLALEQIPKNFIRPMPEPPFERVLGYVPRPEELELGRLLFNDTVLSRNNDVSCATCHLTNHGFATGDPLPLGALGQGGPDGTNVGNEFGKGVLSNNRACGQDGAGFFCDNFMDRNALTTMNVVYRSDPLKDEGLLWDGRFGRLNFQAILPVHTHEELCGVNPMPPKELNLFSSDKKFFEKPVRVQHSFFADRYSGENTTFFNAAPEVIYGVPSFRPNDSATIPVRNECVAIAVAKVRSIPEYRRLFKEAFDAEVSDALMGRALASFISTHVADDTPWDRFIKGERSLTESQIYGALQFVKPRGENFDFNGKKLVGAGCYECHAPPRFTDGKFRSLGVISDQRSNRSRPSHIFDMGNISGQVTTQRGLVAKCHIRGATVSLDESYGPDTGRALVTGDRGDCFSFRTPDIRNVIETFPYFHHGTARGQGASATSLEERAYVALKQVIEYHLRGPFNPQMVGNFSRTKVFFDPLFQMDELIPGDLMSFTVGKGPARKVPMTEEQLSYLTDFVAYGLYDRTAVKEGYLGNDLSHPDQVPSGFYPAITRDDGMQTEVPPNSD